MAPPGTGVPRDICSRHGPHTPPSSIRTHMRPKGAFLKLKDSCIPKEETPQRVTPGRLECGVGRPVLPVALSEVTKYVPGVVRRSALTGPTGRLAACRPASSASSAASTDDAGSDTP